MRKLLSLIVAMMCAIISFAATETTVFYSAPEATIGTYTVKLNVNFKGDGDDWSQMTMTKTKRLNGEDPVYSATFTDKYDGVGVMQFQLYDGATWKSQDVAISSWTSVSTYNGKMIAHANPTTWVAAPAEPVEKVTYTALKAAPSTGNWAGRYLIVFADNKAHATVSGSDLAATSDVLTITSGETEINSTDAYYVTVEPFADGYSIKLPSGKYLSVNANSNKVAEVNAAYAFNFEYTASGIKIFGKDTKGNTRYILNNSTYYRGYVWNDSYKLPTLYRTGDEAPALQTIYFLNSLDWTTVKAFVWPATGDAYKPWSGEAMYNTKEQVDGKYIYAYRFPATYANIIFNNGAETPTQTADLEWAATKPYFVLGATNGEGKYEGSWYASKAEIPTTKYYIIGSMNGWDKKTPIEMTPGNGDSLSVDINLDEKEEYTFKVVKVVNTDTTWYGLKINEGDPYEPMTYENCKGWYLYADGNKDVKLQTTKNGSYKFIFEKNANNEISIVMPEPDPIDTTWYIAGGFNNWAAGMEELKGEKADSLILKVELKSDTIVPFKLVRVRTQAKVNLDTVWFGVADKGSVMKNGDKDWWLLETGYENVGLQPTKIGEYTFVVDPTHRGKVGDEENVLAPIINVIMPEPDPIDTTWYIAGGFNNWAAGMEELKGEKADSLILKVELKSDTIVPFKLVRVRTQAKVNLDTVWFGVADKGSVMKNGDKDWWLLETGYENVGLQPTKIGEYTFVVDPTHRGKVGDEENVLAPIINVIMPEPDPIDTTWYIAGGFNNWAAGMEELKGEKADSLILKVELKSDTIVPFKLVRVRTQAKVNLDTVWFGVADKGSVMKNGDKDWWLLETGYENVGLQPTKIGEYTFVVDPTHRGKVGDEENVLAPTINVIMPEPDPIDTTWYIAGGFNNWAAGMEELKGEKADSLILKVELKSDTIVPFKLVRVRTQAKVNLDTVWFGVADKGSVMKNGDKDWWLLETGYENVGLQPTKIGEYTFVVDPTHRGKVGDEENVLAPTINVIMPEPDPIDTTWYIAGGFNNWAAGMEELKGEKADSLILKVELKSDTIVPFKLVRIRTQAKVNLDTVWFGVADKGSVMKNGDKDWWLLETGYENVGLQPTKIGEYTFVVDPTHRGKVGDEENVLAPIINVIMPEPDPIKMKEITLVPRIWNDGGAKFAAHYWETGKPAAWSAFFTANGTGDTLKAEINEKADNIIFVRFSNEATVPAWENVWNQTEDLKVGESWIFTITGWGEGENPKSVGQWTPYEEPGAQYGLLIDGTTFIGATLNPTPADPSQPELMATNVNLTAGQTFKLYDSVNKQGWVIPNWKSESYQFTITNDVYEVTETGLYHFYVHAEYEISNSWIYVAKEGGTGCENINGAVELRKVIENGVMYIYRDGMKYTVQGYIVR